jgi:hypothetical protein
MVVWVLEDYDGIIGIYTTRALAEQAYARIMDAVLPRHGNGLHIHSKELDIQPNIGKPIYLGEGI